jgi:hypothetical protein
VDVEGYEGFVLRSFQKLLMNTPKAPVLIFELNRDFIEKTDDTPEQIISWLKTQNNYHFAVETKVGFKRDALTLIPDYCNVLAWIPGQHARVEELVP